VIFSHFRFIASAVLLHALGVQHYLIFINHYSFIDIHLLRYICIHTTLGVERRLDTGLCFEPDM
jgi:hypothetical protein